MHRYPPIVSRTRSIRWIALALTALLAACQQNPVSVDYNPDTDFNGYQSYSWQATSGTGSDVEPLLAERVQAAITSVLEQRGIRQSDAAADFQIRYFLAATAQTRDNRSRGSVGVGGGGGNVGVGLSMGFPLGGSKVQQRLQLTIDFVDSSSQKLAWRAVKELALPSNDPQGTSAKIEQAVRDMLAEFPPAAKG